MDIDLDDRKDILPSSPSLLHKIFLPVPGLISTVNELLFQVLEFDTFCLDLLALPIKMHRPLGGYIK